MPLIVLTYLNTQLKRWCIFCLWPTRIPRSLTARKRSMDAGSRFTSHRILPVWRRLGRYSDFNSSQNGCMKI